MSAKPSPETRSSTGAGSRPHGKAFGRHPRPGYGIDVAIHVATVYGDTQGTNHAVCPLTVRCPDQYLGNIRAW